METTFILGDTMAVFSKKLRLKKNGVNEEVYNIYSTIDEVKPQYIQVKLDNNIGYVPIVSGNHKYTGSLKVNVDSTDYSLLTKAEQAYSYTIYDIPGTYTFTVPEYVFKLKVTVIGGGGGAGGSYRGSSYSYDNYATGGTGGESSCGGVVATGGTGGSAWCFWSEDWEGYQWESGYGNSAGIGGTPSGRNGEKGGDNQAVSGGAGFQLLDDKTYGSGGACGAPDNTRYLWDLMGSGGSGGYAQEVIDVVPHSTIAVVVGEGGVGVNNNIETTSYANNGDNGAVQIEWGEGIS